MPILDTHLHLIDKAALRYPWLAGTPALDRSFPLAEVRAEADGLGIAAMLHMEVDVAEDQQGAETALATGLGAPVVGAVAACRPESPGFPAQLEALAANPRVRGLRRILHTSPDELGRRPLFAENLRRLEAHGLPFDLCVLARQLPVAAELASACPGVQFVLDHCGVPDVAAGPAGEGYGAWRAGIAAVAARPNVACKVSGVAAYAGPGWTADTLRPFVEPCLEAFGWDRVVWGSDWPVCTLHGSLTAWVEATHALLAGCREGERDRLLQANARRLYGPDA